MGKVVECGWSHCCCKEDRKKKKNKKKEKEEEDDGEEMERCSSSEQLDEHEDMEMIASYDPHSRRTRSDTLPRKHRSSSFDASAALVSIGMRHLVDPSQQLNSCPHPLQAAEATTTTATATPNSDGGRCKNNYAQEWAFLASVCDRVFFWLCLLFILATTLLLFHPLTTSRFFKIPVIDKN